MEAKSQKNKLTRAGGREQVLDGILNLNTKYQNNVEAERAFLR